MIPTVEQLAMLAATLKRSAKERPGELVRQALDLWTTASLVVDTMTAPEPPEPPPYKEPKSYPVPFDKALRYWLPAKRRRSRRAWRPPGLSIVSRPAQPEPRWWPIDRLAEWTAASSSSVAALEAFDSAIS